MRLPLTEYKYHIIKNFPLFKQRKNLVDTPKINQTDKYISLTLSYKTKNDNNIIPRPKPANLQPKTYNCCK